MSIYAYKVKKTYEKNGNIKEGDIIVENGFRGNEMVVSFFDREKKEFRRHLKAEFLFNFEGDIWTEEGKREFREKLKEMEEKA